MHDERPSHWQATWVVGARMNDIGVYRVYRLRRSDEKESEFPGFQDFAKSSTVEGLRHRWHKTKEFHEVLTEKRFQCLIKHLDLPLQFVDLMISIGVNVRRTASVEIVVIVDHRTEGVDVRLQC